MARLLGVLLLASENAHAVGEPASVWGPSVWGLPTVAWHAINFAILVGGIVWLIRAAVRKGQAARRESISKQIVEATALRDEMRAKFNDYDARMRDIDARMTALVAEARAEAEVDKRRMIAEANVLAARVREDAKLVADQEIARARRELQEEQIAQAAVLAEQILRTHVTKEDQSRLSQEFLGKLESPRSEAAGAGKRDNGRPA